jgi:DEAD/DEAH box helicase domain-containing protein
MKQHLVCAALEHPLSLLPAEKYFGSKNKGDLSFDPSLDSSSTIWSYIIGHEVCYLFKHCRSSMVANI